MSPFSPENGAAKSRPADGDGQPARPARSRPGHQAGELELPIAATFPLDRVQDAYRPLADGHVLGKPSNQGCDLRLRGRIATRRRGGLMSPTSLDPGLPSTSQPRYPPGGWRAATARQTPPFGA